MIKTYVLDTNILLRDPDAMMEGFADNNVVITGTTLQELDKKKHDSGETGYNARRCCRILDTLREENGSLSGGVDTVYGGRLSIVTDGTDRKYLPAGYSLDSPDNRIIAACRSLSDFYEVGKRPQKVILVTNDISMRVNASVCGVEVQSYRNEIVNTTGYEGHVTLYVPDEVVNAIYNGSDGVPAEAVSSDRELCENEFVTLKSLGGSALCIHRNGVIRRIKEPTLFGHVTPKNAMQRYMIHALMAPPEEIPLVIILGPAGTAKTFLSLAAGLTNTDMGFGGSKRSSDGGIYNKILIARPNVESFDNRGFGYLPGSLEEKMAPLLAAYYDNLENILRNGEKEDGDQIRMQIDDMFEDGTVEICPLNTIRGRSLVSSYIIMDEAQNATRGLVRDVVTRSGIGTKVVLLGDPDQIDSPNITAATSGLTYAAEKMRGSSLSAIIRLDSSCSVRSPLAKEAIERM